jgi:hypothetical protein
MEVCICIFYFSFFCLWQESSNLGDLTWSCGGDRVFKGGCLADFSRFSSSTLDPDLHNSVAFSKTHAPQPCSPSSAALAVGSSGHVSCWCPACGLHVPESLLLFGARVATPRFLWPRTVLDEVYGG